MTSVFRIVGCLIFFSLLGVLFARLFAANALEPASGRAGCSCLAEPLPFPGSVLLDAPTNEDLPFPSFFPEIVKPETLDEMLKPKPPSGAWQRDADGVLRLARDTDKIAPGYSDPPEGTTRTSQSQFAIFGGSFNTNLVVHDRMPVLIDPTDRVRWKADESARLPLWGPLYLFGQFAGFDDAVAQEVNFASRMGIGWKLPPWLGGDVQLRGGRAITYLESPRPEDVHEHSEVFIEVQGQWSLTKAIRLEYSGTALPATNPQEHDRINQDLRFAIPFRKTSSFRLGAKRTWESQTLPKTWSESTEVYLGLSLSQ
jgi:hypothetical protein